MRNKLWMIWIGSLIGQLLPMNTDTPRGSRSKCQDLQLKTASISIHSSHKPLWFQKIRNIGQESCAVALTAVRLYTLRNERSDWPEKYFPSKYFSSYYTCPVFLLTEPVKPLICEPSFESVISFQEVIWTNWSESICICSDCALNESSEVVSQSEKKKKQYRELSRYSPTTNVNKSLLCER